MPTLLPCPGHAVQFVDEIQRALCVRRSFHVDANEARRIHRRSFRDQPADDLAGEGFIDIKSHVRQLEADIGVELIGGDGVENLFDRERRCVALRRDW